MLAADAVRGGDCGLASTMAKMKTDPDLYKRLEIGDRVRIPRWVQVRLSLALWMIALIGAILAGYQFEMKLEETGDPDSLAHRVYRLFVCSVVPTAAAIVLLMGRGRVAIPMAVGFLFSTALLSYEFLLGQSALMGPLEIGFLLGAWLGIGLLLWENITLMRAIVSLPISFVLRLAPLDNLQDSVITVSLDSCPLTAAGRRSNE